MSLTKSPKNKSLNKGISSSRKPQLPPTLIKPNTNLSSSLSSLPIDTTTSNNSNSLYNNSFNNSTSLELELDAFALTHQPILLTRKKAALNTSQKPARNPKINGFLPLTTTSSSNSSIDRIEEQKDIVNFIQSYHNTTANTTTAAITSGPLPSSGSGLLRPTYDSNINSAAYDNIISSTIGSGGSKGIRKGVLAKSLKSLSSPLSGKTTINGAYAYDKCLIQSTDSLAIEGDSIEKNDES